MIYWLHHSSIGKTTHAKGTAGANIRYITRPGACSELITQHMPANRWKARHWMNQQEAGSRKNGRVCDKIMLALPRELHPLQRKAMVRQFMEKLTGGKVPWLTAFHDIGVDTHNPHCHIVLRDNCPESGKKILGLSGRGSTKRLQALWRDVYQIWLPKYLKQVSVHSERQYGRNKNGLKLG